MEIPWKVFLINIVYAHTVHVKKKLISDAFEKLADISASPSKTRSV